MREIVSKETELTDIELKRYNECVAEFGCEGHVYFVTESCPGAGYEIYYSTKPASDYYDFDKDCTRVITDVQHMLDVL